MTQIFIPISVSIISPLDAWACQIVGHFFKATCPQYPDPNTRRSENDSTLGRPRSENVNINWVWPLHAGSASWQTASCHQISGRNVISPILPSWPKPIIEYFKVPWTAQKLAKHGHFKVAICFKVLCIILRNFRPITEILKRVRAVTLSLGPVSSQFWKFQSAVERAKIDWAWPFYIAICFMLLCIIPKYQEW